MEANEQYFPVPLFIILYMMVLFSSLCMGFLSITIHMNATDQYFPSVAGVYYTVNVPSLWMKFECVTLKMKVVE